MSLQIGRGHQNLENKDNLDFVCFRAESNKGVAKKDLACVPICFAGLIYRLECGAREDQNTKCQNDRNSFLSFNVICRFSCRSHFLELLMTVTESSMCKDCTLTYVGMAPNWWGGTINIASCRPEPFQQDFFMESSKILIDSLSQWHDAARKICIFSCCLTIWIHRRGTHSLPPSSRI